MGKATLTEDQRLDIIRAKGFESPTPTDQQLADRFGVNKSTVTRVLQKSAQTPLNAAAAGGVLFLKKWGGGGDTPSIDAAQADGPQANGVVDVAWHSIHPCPLNPRKTFDPAKLAELAASIRAKGVLQNIVVRPHPTRPGEFEIAAGERRWRAVAALAGDDAAFADHPLPCRVQELDDIALLEIALTENDERDDVPPLEEAEGYRHLAALMVADGKVPNRKAACEQIGQRLGVSGRHVELRIALTEKLCDTAKTALSEGTITLAHARAMTTGVAIDKNGKLPKNMAEAQADVVKDIRRGWVDTAEEVRDRMTEELETPQADWAIFPLELYTGEIQDDPEDQDVRWLVDAAQAHRLQKEAIDAKAAELKPCRAFVTILRSVDGGHFSQSEWQTVGIDHKDAGAVIVIDADLSVVIHDGVAPLTPKAAKASGKAKVGDDTAGPKPRKSALEAVTKAHAFHARRRKAEAVQDAVAGDFGTALRLACLALAGGTDAVNIHMHGLAPDDKVTGPTVQATLDGYDKDFGKDKNGRWAWAGKDVKVWAKLQEIDGEALENLFAALVASRVFNHTGYQAELGDADTFLAIAETLGLPGRELDLGLGLSGALHETDLDGLQNSALEAIAIDAGIQPGKNGKATRDAIREAGNGVYVPPTMRFGSPKAIAKMLSDADKAFRAQQKTEAKATATATAKAAE